MFYFWSAIESSNDDHQTNNVVCNFYCLLVNVNIVLNGWKKINTRISFNSRFLDKLNDVCLRGHTKSCNTGRFPCPRVESSGNNRSTFADSVVIQLWKKMRHDISDFSGVCLKQEPTGKRGTNNNEYFME